MSEGKKLDDGKLRADLPDANATREFWAVLTHGAIAYDAHNWRKVSEWLPRYIAALERHTNAIARGEIVDPETGLLHAAHIECCAHFIAAKMLEADPDLVARFDERFAHAKHVAVGKRARSMMKNLVASTPQKYEKGNLVATTLWNGFTKHSDGFSFWGYVGTVTEVGFTCSQSPHDLIYKVDFGMHGEQRVIEWFAGDELKKA